MTDALDTLRPEVREAVQELDGKTYSGSRTHLLWQIIRAELLRLADENARLRERVSDTEHFRDVHIRAAGIFRKRAEAAEAELAEARKNETVALGLWNAAEGRATKAEAELAAARETIKRLNRRVQVAEAGIAEKVKASAPGSLGRALANAAADKYMRERDMAQAELAALKARIAQAPLQVVESLPGAVGPPWPGDHWIEVRMADPCACVGQGLIGKRVRLLVEE